LHQPVKPESQFDGIFAGVLEYNPEDDYTEAR
jgi:hypothetical protein